MRLSSKCRYGIRALLFVASRPSAGDPVQSKDVAKREDIPLRYLEQIFRDLVRAGLLESKRGPNGGYRLAHAPTSVSVGTVVRILEGQEPQVGDEQKNRARPFETVTDELCRDLDAHLHSWLDTVTLAELASRATAAQQGPSPMYFI